MECFPQIRMRRAVIFLFFFFSSPLTGQTQVHTSQCKRCCLAHLPSSSDFPFSTACLPLNSAIITLAVITLHTITVAIDPEGFRLQLLHLRVTVLCSDIMARMQTSFIFPSLTPNHFFCRAYAQKGNNNLRVFVGDFNSSSWYNKIYRL